MNRKQQPSAILTGLKSKVSCLWILFFTTQLLTAAILWGANDDPQALMLKKIRAGHHSDRSYVVFVLENPFQFDTPVLQDDEVRFRLRNVKTTLPSFKKFKISETWVKLTMDKEGLNVRVGLFNKLLKFDYEALTSPDRIAITLYPDESRVALSFEDTAADTTSTIDAREAPAAGAEKHLPAVIPRAEESPLITPAPRQNNINVTQAAGSESTGQTRAVAVQAVDENLLTLNFYQSDIREILSALAMQQKINIVTAHDVSGKVSVHLYGVPFDKALNAVCRAGGFSYHKQEDIYYVFKPKKSPEPPTARVEMRIFKFEYADMDKIQEVLAAIPNMRMIQIHEPSKTVVVEDTPENIAKIETLIRYWDTRPKQVLIEAKILEIRLTDDMVLGVDWEKVLGDVRIGTGGFSRARLPTAVTGSISPVPLVGDGIFANMITGAGTTHQFAAALDALQEKTEINTLSTPKILVIHGKTAKVQVGGQQGYTVTTTNQGVSTESVEFIDTGTILEITPYIDHLNNVLLEVKPSLTSAVIEEGVPVTRTTNVTTWMMARNGETVFIGGLIQDIKSDLWTGVPCLGDIPGLKYLFGRSATGIDKTELIILITPYVLEDGGPKPKEQEAIEKMKEAEKHFKEKSSPSLFR